MIKIIINLVSNRDQDPAQQDRITFQIVSLRALIVFVRQHVYIW